VVTAAWAIRVADTGQPALVDRRTVAVVLREACARSLFTVLAPLGYDRAIARSLAGVAEHRLPPVLLLPGLDAGRASLMPLSTFLRQRGWAWVWITHRGGRDSTLAERAEALAAEVERYRQQTGAEQIDIVAFGTGGLLAAWFLKHHDTGGVRRLVTIATPWQGTRIAVFQRGRAALEVLPDSHLLDGLLPDRVPTTCIWSPDDPIVVPTTSAVPDAGVQTVRIEGAGHLEMLLSARVYRAVQAALEQPSDTPLELPVAETA
jgi:triacylglycerol esterase/lipase EstA (alpha/beta hydrolase family)